METTTSPGFISPSKTRPNIREPALVADGAGCMGCRPQMRAVLFLFPCWTGARGVGRVGLTWGNLLDPELFEESAIGIVKSSTRWASGTQTWDGFSIIVFCDLKRLDIQALISHRRT